MGYGCGPTLVYPLHCLKSHATHFKSGALARMACLAGFIKLQVYPKVYRRVSHHVLFSQDLYIEKDEQGLNSLLKPSALFVNSLHTFM